MTEPAEPHDASLTLVATSVTMVWNAVAVANGRTFVAGPRWAGSEGPAVGVLAGDAIKAFPDAAWNSWRAGRDPTSSFVNVNAIHVDGVGGLWVVDTGSPDFGGNPIHGGAKLVRIDVSTARVTRVYPLGPDIALPGSYVDDIRFHGRHAYLTDAGQPALIVLDMASGALRRVLEGHASVMAPAGRDIVVAGRVLKAANGEPVRVHADPMELSPDGIWLYYGPLEGPWSKIETRFLDDDRLNREELASHVMPWSDLPPVGGTAMDSDGSLYFTDLARNALCRRSPEGVISTIVEDVRLHWVDAPFIDDGHRILLPVPQLDRSSVFTNADRPRVWPVELYRLVLPR